MGSLTIPAKEILDPLKKKERNQARLLLLQGPPEGNINLNKIKRPIMIDVNENNTSKSYRGVNDVKSGYRTRRGTILRKTGGSLINDDTEVLAI